MKTGYIIFSHYENRYWHGFNGLNWCSITQEAKTFDTESEAESFIKKHKRAFYGCLEIKKVIYVDNK